MEYHHIVIRVPSDRVAAWEAHIAASFPPFRAPDGFALTIGRDDAEAGIYHMSSVLADRTTVFVAAREAGGGSVLLHPLLERFGAEIVRRDRGTVVGMATPRANYPL
ncbi:MAG: hypothetical protein FJ033_13985 [Chloroflexi bacterium]|nr:hypothetical protein [Chloroflexota bacterium]